MSSDEKCPHCGAELLNYPSPRVAEQDPGARQAACGSILWSDGTQSRTSRCYETAEYVDQLASARARIAELEAANEELRQQRDVLADRAENLANAVSPMGDHRVIRLRAEVLGLVERCREMI